MYFHATLAMCRNIFPTKVQESFVQNCIHGVTCIYFHAPLAMCRNMVPTKVQENFLQNSIHGVTSLHFHAPLVVCTNIVVPTCGKPFCVDKWRMVMYAIYVRASQFPHEMDVRTRYVECRKLSYTNRSY